MAEFSIRFGMPENGWMGIDLFNNSGDLRILASHVSFDGLEQLVLCLGNVLLSKPASMDWMLEPQVYHFEFKTEKGLTIFQVKEHLYETVKTHFEVEMPSFDLVLVFWRSLRCFQAQSLDNDFEKGWNYPFPEKELDKLTEELREAKRKQK